MKYFCLLIIASGFLSGSAFGGLRMNWLSNGVQTDSCGRIIYDSAGNYVYNESRYLYGQPALGCEREYTAGTVQYSVKYLSDEIETCIEGNDNIFFEEHFNSIAKSRSSIFLKFVCDELFNDIIKLDNIVGDDSSCRLQILDSYSEYCEL
ncbi:MAG: hypothetical protein JXA66_08740 [Oligoflexia bacterium]|nr:hypothetical protein [Oligoflexia bacterium]